MLFNNNCCEKRVLNVFPPRVFETIPDEVRYEAPAVNNTMEQEPTTQTDKPFIRNRLILLFVLLLLAAYFY